jgi:hypothetical protein
MPSEKLERPRGGTSPVRPGRQGRRPLTAFVEPPLHRAVRHCSVEMDRPVQDLIIEALTDWLAKHRVKIDTAVPGTTATATRTRRP